MRFLSLTTAAACSLQTQAGAPAGQAAQSAVQRSPPSVTHIMGYCSFNRPRRDGRLSWPCWLTDSGRRSHKVVKQPSISLVQDKESPPARTDVLTTMLHHCDSLTASQRVNSVHSVMLSVHFFGGLPFCHTPPTDSSNTSRSSGMRQNMAEKQKFFCVEQCS